ncbi:hypothetical protein [Marinivivus vitaminiproducens]|uniref:hypothetical protein n=1 Tax=Marinivivus vitaminiproducens TaxID=3035935 RepID=UPI0027A37F4D|nr:hypothetical protein P4R82_00305 [Geminicoccaceae bacterium SCSIO 64248]
MSDTDAFHVSGLLQGLGNVLAPATEDLGHDGLGLPVGPITPEQQAEIDYLGQASQAEVDYLGQASQAEIDYLNRDAQAEIDYYNQQNGAWSAGDDLWG